MDEPSTSRSGVGRQIALNGNGKRTTNARPSYAAETCKRDVLRQYRIGKRDDDECTLWYRRPTSWTAEMADYYTTIDESRRNFDCCATVLGKMRERRGRRPTGRRRRYATSAHLSATVAENANDDDATCARCAATKVTIKTIATGACACRAARGDRNSWTLANAVNRGDGVPPGAARTATGRNAARTTGVGFTTSRPPQRDETRLRRRRCSSGRQATEIRVDGLKATPIGIAEKVYVR